MAKSDSSGGFERGPDTNEEFELEDGQQFATICPSCCTISAGENFEGLRLTASIHNENRHDGERIARTHKPIESHIEMFRNAVRRNYSDAVADALEAEIEDRKPWGVLDG